MPRFRAWLGVIRWPRSSKMRPDKRASDFVRETLWLVTCSFSSAGQLRTGLCRQWRVLASQGLSLEHHLADVKPIAKEMCERAACEGDTPHGFSGLQSPDLGDNASLAQFRHKQVEAAKLEIASEDAAHTISLGFIDGDLPVLWCRIRDGAMPPTHIPLRLEAAILSRIRSEVTSRSNWANDSSTFSVSRPIEVVVLNCCVTETNDTLCRSNNSTSLAKSANERVRRSTL